MSATTSTTTLTTGKAGMSDKRLGVWAALTSFFLMWVFLWAVLVVFRPTWVCVTKCDSPCGETVVVGCDRKRDEPYLDHGRAFGVALVITLVVMLIVLLVGATAGASKC
jgi:hypothetical protein